MRGIILSTISSKVSLFTILNNKSTDTFLKMLNHINSLINDSFTCANILLKYMRSYQKQNRRSFKCNDGGAMTTIIKERFCFGLNETEFKTNSNMSNNNVSNEAVTWRKLKFTYIENEKIINKFHLR